MTVEIIVNEPVQNQVSKNKITVNKSLNLKQLKVI